MTSRQRVFAALDWKSPDRALHLDVMDIHSIKRKYGGRGALVGNVFISDFVGGTPENL